MAGHHPARGFQLTKNDQVKAEEWLSAELNRVWLIAERSLRALQKAQVRPQSGHPTLAEVEAVLTARRVARRGAGAANQVESEEEINAAITEIEKELPALRREAPLGRLVTQLGLRPLEVEVIAAVIAPQLEAPLATLYSALRGPNTTRRGTDLALLAQMFRLKRTERITLLDAIDGERPLVKWRLLEVLAQSGDSSVAHQALRPSFRLLNLLCGRGEVDPVLARSTQILSAEAKHDDLVLNDTVRENVTEACRAAAAMGENMPWLILWGAAGSGKKTLAARIAAHARRSVVAFDPSAIDKGTFNELFDRAQTEALIRGAMLFVGPLVAELEADGAHHLVQRLKVFPGMVAIGLDRMSPPRIAADVSALEIEVEIPSQANRLALWDKHLPEEHRGDDVELDFIAKSFSLVPGEIIGIAAETIALAGAEGDRVSHLDLRSGVDRRLRTELGELATRITPVVRWRDLVLPPHEMARVREFISRKKNRDLVYRSWGYGRRVGGYGQGLTALFSGPPGTGKTMLAGLIAKELDLDLYKVDLAQVVSKWVGETEKQLAKVFDQAERAHAVLLFDEADSLFAKRTEVKTSNDRYGNLAVNYLLQRLETYEGVAVLTTNKDAQLDDALQRRLTLHLRLEIPGEPERERLWRTFLPEEAPITGELDFSELASSFELSGGYIKNAAVRAAFLAADRGVSIDMGLFKLAAGLELEDMGRVVMRGDETFASELVDVDPGFDFTDT
jgi:MoxR-like ATPase